MIAICRASLRFMNFTSWTPENISSVFAWRILSFWDLLWLKLWENRSVFFFFELQWFVPTASDNILKPTDTTAQRLTIRLMSQNFSAVATQEKKIRNLFLWFFFVSVIFSNDLIRADPRFSLYRCCRNIFTSVMFVFWIDNSRLILYADDQLWDCFSYSFSGVEVIDTSDYLLPLLICAFHA